jgi:hypothetical protein
MLGVRDLPPVQAARQLIRSVRRRKEQLMKPVVIVLSVLCLGWSSLPSGAADLTKIDRSIAKEPTYKTEPYYALVVLGPKAEKRVWLVVAGEVLCVDRNGNSDLTEANERVTLDIEATKKIQVAPGMYKGMNSFDIGEVAGLRLRLDFWVREKAFVPKTEFDKAILKDHQEKGWEFATLWRDGSQAQIPVTFCRRPKDAQICHLAGPLTFAMRRNHRLERHNDKNTLQVTIGTPGLPPRESSDPVFAPIGTNEVPPR